MTVVVTPTLFVGDEPMRFDDVVRCTSAVDAVAVIRAGGSARVPTMDVAADTLRMLGCAEDTVAERIAYAST